MECIELRPCDSHTYYPYLCSSSHPFTCQQGPAALVIPAVYSIALPY